RERHARHDRQPVVELDDRQSIWRRDHYIRRGRAPEIGSAVTDEPSPSMAPAFRSSGGGHGTRGPLPGGHLGDARGKTRDRSGDEAWVARAIAQLSGAILAPALQHAVDDSA